MGIECDMLKRVPIVRVTTEQHLVENESHIIKLHVNIIFLNSLTHKYLPAYFQLEDGS